ncbi:hypothetical protein CCAN12_730056 [Capnocytophaga canimorsus]|uniref:Uncharacterized protein n=1 Tax=Capnocytophaga canimorsus TaxID=28188 RepID=A0A0B7HIH1_9FLAO|nr:hypothetical protein CCAN12_730056 [Capnocytophaga canimorsus]
MFHSNKGWGNGAKAGGDRYVNFKVHPILRSNKSNVIITNYFFQYITFFKK